MRACPALRQLTVWLKTQNAQPRTPMSRAGESRQSAQAGLGRQRGHDRPGLCQPRGEVRSMQCQGRLVLMEPRGHLEEIVWNHPLKETSLARGSLGGHGAGKGYVVCPEASCAHSRAGASGAVDSPEHLSAEGGVAGPSLGAGGGSDEQVQQPREGLSASPTGDRVGPLSHGKPGPASGPRCPITAHGGGRTLRSPVGRAR